METLLLIIVFVIGIIVIARSVDKKEEKMKEQNLQKKLIMKSKYKTLIEGIFPPDLDIKTIRETPDELVRRMDTGTGVTTISIKDLGNNTKISWEFYHVLYGDHSKDWLFENNIPQELMLDSIYDDIDEINKNFM